MTPYEITYLVIVFIQTVFLIWYAMETYKLRKDAAKGNSLMEKQISAAAKQNRLMEFQLAAVAKSQAFHEKTLEDAADAHFHVYYGGDVSSDQYGIVFANISENVKLTDFAASEKLVSVRFPENDHGCTFVVNEAPVRNVYLGVEYKTKRGEVKTKVYRTWTETGLIEEAPNFDYRLLTSYIKG